MLTGTFSVPRVIEESICRSAEDDKFTDISDHKIHSTTIMPNIKFEQAREEPVMVDSSIIINNSNTSLTFDSTVEVQNYITCKYIGPADLEFYGPPTKMGREFVLLCRNGNPNYEFRSFGTEDAIRGFNRSSNENVQLPKTENDDPGRYDPF